MDDRISLGDTKVLTADRLARFLGASGSAAGAEPEGMARGTAGRAAFGTVTGGGFLDLYFHHDCVRSDRAAWGCVLRIPFQETHSHERGVLPPDSLSDDSTPFLYPTRLKWGLWSRRPPCVGVRTAKFSLRLILPGSTRYSDGAGEKSRCSENCCGLPKRPVEYAGHSGEYANDTGQYRSAEDDH
ncbi:hypothetical protein AB0P45_09970 [Streptomyces niveus]|uniref:hypothetical protein n=1 Tax=Streptomyces niveus TaxID=193462 RepID=UPI0034318BD2